MPLRMIDWRCTGKCGRKWEELTSVTEAGQALAPRCCGLMARRLPSAPAIRTNDNFPRDMRLTTTAGHPVEGTDIKAGRDVISSQLGRGFGSRDEHDHYIREMNAGGHGIEIVTAAEYDRRHLGVEPPPPRLEDDPQLLRAAQEEAADIFDQAEAGALPPIETPMLDQDAEGRQMVQQMTNGSAAEQLVAMEADEGA